MQVADKISQGNVEGAQEKAAAIKEAAETNSKAKKEAVQALADSNERVAQKNHEVGMAKVKIEVERVAIEKKQADSGAILQIAKEILNTGVSWDQAWQMACSSYRALDNAPS